MSRLTSNGSFMDWLNRLRGDLEASHHRLVGAALLRIGLSLSALEFYISSVDQRRFLFSPRSIAEQPVLATFHEPWTLWSFAHSSMAEDMLFFAGVGVAFLWLILGGRILGLLHAVLLISIYRQNGIVGNGGDNFAQILVLLAPLLVTSAYFSPLASRTRRKLPSASSSVCVIHNLAIGLALWQTCLVYTAAGGTKLLSHQWRTGSALHDALALREFRWIGVAFVLVSIKPIGRLLSWGVVASQLLVLPSVVLRRWTPVVLGLIAAMHIGIMTAMGLVGFGLAMLAGDAICLSDKHYHDLARLVARKAHRLRGDAVSLQRHPAVR